MVIVRLMIPIGVNTKDRLDVQVEVPPACGTTSLAGGYLMQTRLREVRRSRQRGPWQAQIWPSPRARS